MKNKVDIILIHPKHNLQGRLYFQSSSWDKNTGDWFFEFSIPLPRETEHSMLYPTLNKSLSTLKKNGWLVIKD